MTQKYSSSVVERVPVAPVVRVLDATRQFSIASTETIRSRSANPGETFTGSVAADVRDDAARVAIPKGSLVSGTITEVKSAPNSRGSGALTLVVNNVTVRGKNYPLEARIDSLATERARQPISGSGTGARVVVETKDREICVPAGTHVIITLTQRLTLTGN